MCYSAFSFCFIGFFRTSGKIYQIFAYIFSILPALVGASLILILVDNFTYTVFKFGIVSTQGISRALYAFFFILCVFFVFRKIIPVANKMEIRLFQKSKISSELALALLVLVLALWIFVLAGIYRQSGRFETFGNEPFFSGQRPNIILITADGLNAENMSVYGYKNNTTPFLNELAQTSLVAENTFSNAQGTIGSLTSLLSGKYPFDTDVIRSTDILKDEDTYQHFPAILKTKGYYTAQINYSYYADAYRVNIQHGFDEANGKYMEHGGVISELSSLLPTNYFYFLQEIATRLSDRIGHIFFLQDMTNPYIQVTLAPEKVDDLGKFTHALTLLDSASQPLFIHIHWMGTHGPKFYPAKQVFSEGVSIENQSNHNVALYDDSILEFDQTVSAFYAALTTRGLQNKTVIIIASDHSQMWSTSRLPLIIHFPDSMYAGRVSENTQNMDIVPTLLDFMNIPQPEWMPGQSLLNSLDPNRIIFIAAIPSSSRDAETGKVVYPDPVPPFYQFGKITVVKCDRWFKVNLLSLEMTTGIVPKYSTDCDANGFDEKVAIQAIKEHLTSYGYETEQLDEVVYKP